MLKRFYPKEYVDSIYAIDFDKFLTRGIKALIFDIDNTLVTHDIPEPSKKIIQFLAALSEKGFKICLLSNNKEERVKLFNQKLGYFYVFKAGKPKKKGINRALASVETSSDKVVLIGDQMFTDCWCGNRCGIYTILVKPIASKDEWTVKLKRGPEKLVMKAYMRYAAKQNKQ